MFSILQSGFKRITKAALVVEIDENDWLLPVIQCRLSIDLPTFDTIHSNNNVTESSLNMTI